MHGNSKYQLSDKGETIETIQSNSLVWMWELDHREGWALKNRCFQTVMLKKTLESPWQQGDQTSNPKGNQPWIFIGRTDPKAEAPILWPPDMKSRSLERSWCCERLRAGGEGGDRGWDGWMASQTWWTWGWANSGREWRTEEPGMLLSTKAQRVRHNLVTEPQRGRMPVGF